MDYSAPGFRRLRNRGDIETDLAACVPRTPSEFQFIGPGFFLLQLRVLSGSLDEVRRSWLLKVVLLPIGSAGRNDDDGASAS
jgi:hypothetical protein